MLRLLFTALALACHTLAISPIHVKGSKLFTEGGSQFFVKGIAYQLVEDDPLVNTEQCKLDAALMQELGANSIRVYHVEPNADHDGCMRAFADAGIYAWIDLDTFDTYIYFDGNPPRWTQTMYKAYQKVMDAFHTYDNVAGFFVGNEMLTVGADSTAAAYVKAAARDMKAYRKKMGYREIPVGYSAADIADLRPNLQNYMACGSDSTEALDFYSLNAYEWCGETTYEESGYNMLQENASDYNIPIFFSETGCNTPSPRTFDDQTAIFGDEMADTWSGSIIYEWIEEANNYGLISYAAPQDPTATASNVVDGFVRAGTPTPISPDFENLSNHWATLNPTGVSENAYKPSASPPPCPTFTSGMWEVNGDAPLPTIGAKAATFTSDLTSSNPTKASPQTTAKSDVASASAASSSSTSSAAAPTKAFPLSLKRQVVIFNGEKPESPKSKLFDVGMMALTMVIAAVVL
ncbi:uncharacterized protein LTR77_000745 [Saxophila tyrrhenica]|uniref:1,3-beta-glucanosyltransferase n=1 Tax=Saxophila tyrrhenica TaxID=1690608 RepID=A0AAV9PP74_9PEZI|nr:hypothetical protein LTR77_000745 [Saxophila tyrrhenica]